MSLSRETWAIRGVLKKYSKEALEGTLTIEDVVREVRKIMPLADREGIYQAITHYGPLGEGKDGNGDLAWYRRIEKLQVPGWFYDPIEEPID